MTNSGMPPRRESKSERVPPIPSGGRYTSTTACTVEAFLVSVRISHPRFCRPKRRARRFDAKRVLESPRWGARTSEACHRKVGRVRSTVAWFAEKIRRRNTSRSAAFLARAPFATHVRRERLSTPSRTTRCGDLRDSRYRPTMNTFDARSAWILFSRKRRAREEASKLN